MTSKSMSRRPPESISLATTALYYAAIAALMTACLQLNGRGPISVQLEMSGSLLFYALANAALVYGLLHLAIEGARRLPGVGRLAFLLLSNLLFTALIATLALHFVLLWRFGSALDAKLLSLISEPGFFLTIGVGGRELAVVAAGLVCVYAAFVGLAASKSVNSASIIVRLVCVPLLPKRKPAASAAGPAMARDFEFAKPTLAALGC